MSTYIHKKAVLKSTAGLLAAVLCLEVPASAAPAVLTPSASIAASASAAPALSLRFAPEVAVVDERYETSGARRIFLIQDAHTNGSAQLNSARVIETLIESRPIRTIFLEAGTGDDSLTPLRTAAPAASRARAARRLVNKGLLQGAEYVNLVSDRDLTLWGVEDPELYSRALEAYRTVTASREAAAAHLDRVDVAIDLLKEKTFAPALIGLDRARRSFVSGDLSAAGYLEVLEKTARVSGMDLSDTPGFARVSRLVRREKAVRPDRAADEMRRAVAELPRTSQDELNRFFEPGGTPRPSGTAVWARVFRAEAGPRYRALMRRYPNLSAYLRTAQELAALDGLGALRSMRELETRLYARLARPRARELARAGFAAEALRDLVSMKLEPEALDRLRGAGGRVWDITTLTGFTNRRLMDLGQGAEKTVFLKPELEPAFTAAMDFYRLTLSRDEAFVRGLEARLDETGEREAVLVAGGYHAANLKKLFRERGISFVSVIPQTVHPTDHARYERLLLAQSSVPGSARGTAAAMSLRPVAEDGARLALVAAELGAGPVTAGARMTSAAPLLRPEFLKNIPDVVPQDRRSAIFTTEFRWPEGRQPEGQFFLRRGLPNERWDFLPVTPVLMTGSGENRWSLSVQVEPYVEGTRRYEGTFVWFVPGIRPRKRQGFDEEAVWQARSMGENAGIDLTLSPDEASQQWQASAAAVRTHLGQETETPLQKVLPFRTIPAIRGAVQQAVELMSQQPRDLHVRLRLYQFLRDVYNLDENYLQLPAMWFLDSTGLETIQQFPPAANLNSSESVSELFWSKIIDVLREELKQRLHSHFSSRIGVPKLRRPEEVTDATADPRIDLMHGGVAKDLPVFAGSGQAVVNAAVRLKDYAGRAVPGFGVRVRMPLAHNPTAPAIRFAGHYYNILKPDDDSPDGYAVIRKYEHVYDASFSPDAAEDLNAKYVIGALKLLMELIGQAGLEEFLRVNSRDIDIEVDSFVPERTGMGGSVTLGALVTSALLEHLLLLDKFTHEDVALLGMYLEASLGDLGGWQDGILGPALRLLRIEKGEPVTTLKNTVPFDRKGGKAQRDLLHQLETHGVLFLTHPHRSSHTLRQLIGGQLRRDEAFTGAAQEAQEDLSQFLDEFSTAVEFNSGVSIEKIAGWMNRATGQFETAAPGFMTQDMKDIVAELSRRNWIRAAKPVGAGAGGFLFLLLTNPAFRPQVEAFLAEWARTHEDRIRSQVRENFLPPGVYGVAFDPDLVTGRVISHRDHVGARMAEVELKGDSPASGAAWGTAAIYEPETAEGILFRIPSEDIETYAADFRRLTGGVLQAIPTLNGAPEEKTSALAEYFTGISDGILREFTESRGRGERAVNPIARLIRRIKGDLEAAEGGEDPEVLTLRQMLVDEVRAQSLHLAHLTDSDDPQTRLAAAQDEAVRGKRILQGSVERYVQTLEAIDQNIRRLDGLIKIKTGQLERKNQLAAEIRAGRAVSGLGADKGRYFSAKEAAKKIQEVIDRSVIHRESLAKRRDIIEVFKLLVEGNLLDKYFSAADPDGLVVRERMIRENRRFDAVIYEDMLVKSLLKRRRKIGLLMRTQPDQAPFHEKINEMILEVTQVMARISKDRGSDDNIFQLQTSGSEGHLVLFVHDVLSEDILREIWNQHGHRIRAVVTTSATMVSHWVIVARGLPNPPAIVLIKDADAIRDARRVRSGQLVAVAAHAGTGSSRVHVNPVPERREQVDRVALEAERVHRHAVRSMGEVSPLPILANVTPQEHSGLAELGADGVGLVRTEVWDQEELEAMLSVVNAFGTSQTAEAEFQRVGLHWFFLYRRLLNDRALHRNKATFRTLDIQWDKNHQFLERLQRSVQERPQDFPVTDPDKLTGFDLYRTSLGAELLARQIAAMGLARFDLRGTNQSPQLRIMFPDVKTAEDLEYLVRHILPRAEEIFHWIAGRESAKWSLLPKALQPYDEKRRPVGEFGLMIETAEALEGLEALAAHPLSGFWSVGTNDLTASMETLSLKRKSERSGDTQEHDHRVSRDEPQYEKLFTTLTPKLLKAADRIAAAAAASGRKLEVGFCGEIAGTDKFLLYLLHLRHHGAHLYSSMALPRIAQAKLLIRLADKNAAKRIGVIFDEINAGDDARARRLAAELIAEEMRSASAASSGARMSDSDWSRIDWSLLGPDAIRTFVLESRKAAMKNLDWDPLGPVWNEGRALIRQQEAAIQLRRFLGISSGPLKRFRDPHAPLPEIEAELIEARREIIDRWKRFESAKVAYLSAHDAPVTAGWPSGPSEVWRSAEHILKTLESLSALLHRHRRMLKPEGALGDFENVIENRLVAAMARVLFSAPFKDAKAREWVDGGGIRELGPVLAELSGVLSADRDQLFLMPAWDFDGEKSIRNHVRYLHDVLLGWSRQRREELPPLPPGPMSGAQASAHFIVIGRPAASDARENVARNASAHGVDLTGLIRNAVSMLEQLEAEQGDILTDQALASVRVSDDLEQAVWTFSGRRNSNRLYGLDVPERRIVRRWIQTRIAGQRERGEDERTAQKLLVFFDRIGDAIELATSADLERSFDGRVAIAPLLSLLVWRPVVENYLAYVLDQEDPDPALDSFLRKNKEAMNAVPGRLLTAAKTLDLRSETADVPDFGYSLAAQMARAAGEALQQHLMLLEQESGARLAGSLSASRSGSARLSRDWASRPSAVRYWTDVAAQPASAGRSFAVWTGDRTRIWAVRPISGGKVRVYETAVQGGRSRTRPILTLPFRSSAARMSSRRSHFTSGTPSAPDWVGPVQAFLRLNHLEVVPALNDAADPKGGLIRPAASLEPAEQLRAIAAIRVLDLRRLGLNTGQLSKDPAAEKVGEWLKTQDVPVDPSQSTRFFNERVPLLPIDHGTYLPGSEEIRISEELFQHFTRGRVTVSVEPSTSALLAQAVAEARRDTAVFSIHTDKTQVRAAVLDLSIFEDLDNDLFVSLVPMIAAAADRARKRAGGSAVVRIKGSKALRDIFFAAADDAPARGMFFDESDTLPDPYRTVEPGRIGVPVSLHGAHRPLPVQPIGPATGGRISFPAVELWFDAAFYLSAPDASAERLYEFFKKRTGRDDFTLEDVRGLMSGNFDLSLLHRLALPPLLRAPLADLVRAAAAAARMSERSA